MLDLQKFCDLTQGLIELCDRLGLDTSINEGNVIYFPCYSEEGHLDEKWCLHFEFKLKETPCKTNKPTTSTPATIPSSQS